MSDRTSFSFCAGYSASKVILELDGSVICGLKWVPFTVDISEAHPIGPHEFVSLENHKYVSVVHQKVVVLVVSGRLTRMDAEVAYHYYLGSPKSAALSRRSLAASPRPSGSDDVYGGNLDDYCDVDTDDSDAATAGRWK